MSIARSGERKGNSLCGHGEGVGNRWGEGKGMAGGGGSAAATVGGRRESHLFRVKKYCFQFHSLGLCYEQAGLHFLLESGKGFF